MGSDTPRTAMETIMYLTECTLATVGSMAIKKSRSKSEYGRQISIAQTGIDFLNRECSADWKDYISRHLYVGRVLEIMDGKLTVASWVMKYEIIKEK
jgi:hypothetical protein